MAKMTIECADPNDFKSVLELAEQAVGKCNITYANTAKALIEAGTVKSEREAARKIAEGTDEPVETVRHRIKEGKKEVGGVSPKPETLTKSTTSTELEKLDFEDGEDDVDAVAEYEEEFDTDDDQPAPSGRPRVETNRSAFDRVVTETKKQTQPQHGGARPGSGRKPKHGQEQEQRREYVSSNPEFASIAISQLERIRHHNNPDDAIAALIMVKKWIEDRIEAITRGDKNTRIIS